jgi:hypothetical protein
LNTHYIPIPSRQLHRYLLGWKTTLSGITRRERY